MKSPCSPRELQKGSVTIGADFSTCLSFGSELWSCGGVVQFKPAKNIPPDGVYTSLTIKNGCIIDVGHADLLTHDAHACDSCSFCESSSSSYVPQSQLRLIGGAGISVYGEGSIDDPYVISWSGSYDVQDSPVYAQAGNAALLVSGSGTQGDPLTISHATQHQYDTIDGMLFDKYGHLISYTPSTDSSHIRGIIGSDGIDVSVDTATQVATVKLQQPSHDVSGSYAWGANTVQVDKWGRIYNIFENESQVQANALSRSSVVKYFATSTTHSISVSLAEATSILVVIYKISNGLSATVEIDNQSIPMRLITENHSIAFSNAVYSVGIHNVSVTAPEGSVATISAVQVA